MSFDSIDISTRQAEFIAAWKGVVVALARLCAATSEIVGEVRQNGDEKDNDTFEYIAKKAVQSWVDAYNHHAYSAPMVRLLCAYAAQGETALGPLRTDIMAERSEIYAPLLDVQKHSDRIRSEAMLTIFMFDGKHAMGKDGN